MTSKSNKSVSDNALCIPSTPSGEDLEEGEIEKLLIATQQLLQLCQTKIDDTKIDCHSLLFMLLRIKDSLDVYRKDYMLKLNTFLVQADNTTAEYYAQMCCALPKYGDHVEKINSERSEKLDLGGLLVNKDDLLCLVRGVTDNCYTEALLLRSGRDVLRDVKRALSDRKYIVARLDVHMPRWMEIQDAVTCQLENFREEIFQIYSHLNFFKQGDSRVLKSYDVSALELLRNLGDCNNECANMGIPRIETPQQSEDNTKIGEEPSRDKTEDDLDPKPNIQVTEQSLSNNKDDDPNDIVPKPNIQVTEQSLNSNKDDEPKDIDSDSDDDIFAVKGRIRKLNKTSV